MFPLEHRPGEAYNFRQAYKLRGALNVKLIATLLCQLCKANICCVMKKTRLLVKISGFIMCKYHFIGKTVKY